MTTGCLPSPSPPPQIRVGSAVILSFLFIIVNWGVGILGEKLPLWLSVSIREATSGPNGETTLGCMHTLGHR